MGNRDVLVPFSQGAAPGYGRIACIQNPGLNPADLDQDRDVDGIDLALLTIGDPFKYHLQDLHNAASYLGFVK